MNCPKCNKLGIECSDCFARRIDKGWVKSPEGQKALTQARKEAEEAIKQLEQPSKLMVVQCTCCPIHGRKN